MPPRPATPRPADHLRLVRPSAAVPSAAPRKLRAAAAPAPRAGALGDWAWQGLGVGVATASAGFAAYALVFSSGEVVPSGNFNVFARYDRLYQAASAQHAGPSRGTDPSGAPPAPSSADVAGREGVDLTPTGSVAKPGPAGGGAGRGGPARGGADGPPLLDFTLRDVFDGKALVESRSTLSVIKPGSVLDGAGEVLSIQKRGERWVVLTQNGVIGGQRR